MERTCSNCFWKTNLRAKPCTYGIEFPFEPCHMFDPKCCMCKGFGKHKHEGQYYCAEHLEEVTAESYNYFII